MEDLKRQHLYRKEASAEASAIEFLEFRADHSPDIKGSKSTQCLEVLKFQCQKICFVIQGLLHLLSFQLLFN